MKLNIAKSISAIHTLHININIVLYVVQAKKKRMPKSPANLSLKKASSLNWGDLNSIYFFVQLNCHSKKWLGPSCFYGEGLEEYIYVYNFKYWFLKRCREWCQPFFARCKDNTHALATKAQRSGPNPMHFFALYTKQLWTESLLLLVQPFFKNHTVGYRSGENPEYIGRVFRVEL